MPIVSGSVNSSIVRSVMGGTFTEFCPRPTRDTLESMARLFGLKHTLEDPYHDNKFWMYYRIRNPNGKPFNSGVYEMIVQWEQNVNESRVPAIHEFADRLRIEFKKEWEEINASSSGT